MEMNSNCCFPGGRFSPKKQGREKNNFPGRKFEKKSSNGCETCRFCCSTPNRSLRFLEEKKVPPLKLTFSHLKMDGWNTIVSFWGPAYFQGRTVSFRDCNGEKCLWNRAKCEGSRVTAFLLGHGVKWFWYLQFFTKTGWSSWWALFLNNPTHHFMPFFQGYCYLFHANF